jgi:hypothetical protein
MARGRHQNELLSEIRASTPTYPPSTSTDPYTWAKESQSIAQKVTYRFSGFACGQTNAASLDDFYDQKATLAIKGQLSIAGKRLAIIINQSLDR